jgi:hypothetical protein
MLKVKNLFDFIVVLNAYFFKNFNMALISIMV